MGRAHSNDDIDDTDGIGIEADIDDISSPDIVEMSGSKDDGAETRSVTSRCRIREQLNSDIDAYLASGGCISHVDTHLVVLPQRRNSDDYGSRLH